MGGVEAALHLAVANHGDETVQQYIKEWLHEVIILEF